MEESWKSWKLDDLELLLASTFEVDGVPENLKGREAMIEVLEYLLYVLRYDAKQFDKKLRFEDFLQGELIVSDRGLHFTLPQKPKGLGSGIPSSALEPDLLLFLLLHHRRKYQVLDIITAFVNRLYDRLTVLDFKKTDTGVIRCYTNTRFAAKRLREYGLLKSNSRVAYKTWVLSLPGFVVAARLLQKRLKHGDFPLEKSQSPVLHRDIMEAWKEVRNIDGLVEVLSSVCLPNSDCFDSFPEFLSHAYRLLDEYWGTLRNPDLNRDERQEKCRDLLAELEAQADSSGFYDEFSKCLNVEALLAQVFPSDKPPDDRTRLF